MDDSNFKGLIGAVGKAIALSSANEDRVEAIERLDSPEALRNFLERVDLGISEPTRSDFIREATGERWRDYQAQLASSVNLSFHEFTSPSA